MFRYFFTANLPSGSPAVAGLRAVWHAGGFTRFNICDNRAQSVYLIYYICVLLLVTIPSPDSVGTP